MLSRRHLLTGAALLAASAAFPRAWAQAPSGPFKLDPLPYPPCKNEPHIDAQTMEIHHDKHHAAYVNESQRRARPRMPRSARMPLHEMLANLGKVPEAIRTAVRNNGGGHANHTMFWQIMGGSGGEPAGEVKAAIDRDLGGFAEVSGRFQRRRRKHVRLGLGVRHGRPRTGKLALVTKPNQDTPLMDGQRVLIGNDVWEHAYYLKYQNRRPDYLKAWWNVVDWNKIGERYAAAKAGTLTV